MKSSSSSSAVDDPQQSSSSSPRPQQQQRRTPIQSKVVEIRKARRMSARQAAAFRKPGIGTCTTTIESPPPGAAAEQEVEVQLCHHQPASLLLLSQQYHLSDKDAVPSYDEELLTKRREAQYLISNQDAVPSYNDQANRREASSISNLGSLSSGPAPPPPPPPDDYAPVKNFSTDATIDEIYDDKNSRSWTNGRSSTRSDGAQKTVEQEKGNVDNSRAQDLQEKSSSTETTTNDDIDDADEHPSLAVWYQEGATKLFRTIEARRWDEASLALRDDPGQAKTWVMFRDDDDRRNDRFLWRRLPIQEAIRQQAPTSFIIALLRVHGSAAGRQTTHFGELPLHLAIDHGNAPDTIRLILLHHLLAIRATDQGGRTPVDALRDAVAASSSWPASDGQSLRRTFRAVEHTLCEIQAAQDMELKRVVEEHSRVLSSEVACNETRVKAEMKRSSVLEEQIAAMKNDMKAQQKRFDEKLFQFEGEKKQLSLSLMASQIAAAKAVQDWQDARASHRDEVATLRAALDGAVNRWRSPHWNVVQTQLAESTRTFEALEATLLDHQEDLEVLLETIGLEPVLPPPPDMAEDDGRSQEERSVE